MNIYHFPTSTVNAILNNPTLLGTRLSSNSSNTTSTSSSPTLSSLAISDDMATHILNGYTTGFRIVFILNAALCALAVVASVLMIGQKDLSRDDDAKKKRMEEIAREKQKSAQEDVEMKVVEKETEVGTDSAPGAGAGEQDTIELNSLRKDGLGVQPMEEGASSSDVSGALATA